jgi:hypothetical protein
MPRLAAELLPAKPANGSNSKRQKDKMHFKPEMPENPTEDFSMDRDPDKIMSGQLELSLAAAEDAVSSRDAGGAHAAHGSLAAVVESYVQQERSGLSLSRFPPGCCATMVTAAHL